MQNPNRPTRTWILWVIGIIGGAAYSVWLVSAGDDPQATRQIATNTGAWAYRALAVGAIGLGGWGVLRRRTRKEL